ncbi:vitamin D3 hydroxylase-associated protein-like [Suncus etruscus]|uniref:vitamin D3 hydroxylase-associated protein-like n=1 Tax=Suncus etruscus TaxID=109475 RepID=UPI00210F8841|nr:vitamin D3 hydroxylase-associated protein-like [Suncus etruscus]
MATPPPAPHGRRRRGLPSSEADRNHSAGTSGEAGLGFTGTTSGTHRKLRCRGSTHWPSRRKRRFWGSRQGRTRKPSRRDAPPTRSASISSVAKRWRCRLAHGGDPGGSCSPLASSGHRLWDLGLRSPVASWPGPRGSRSLGGPEVAIADWPSVSLPVQGSQLSGSPPLAWRKVLEAKAARARGLLEQQLCQAKAAVQNFWQKHLNICHPDIFVSPQHPNIHAESIVCLSLLELTQKLQEGVLCPELVVYSYMEQVLQAQKELNCLTGLVPGWEQQLQELQQRLHRGPLYGVPISLKDSYQCQGQVSSCGTFTLLDSPAMEDSVIVKVLKSQGAVVFAKTNIPQAMMSYNSGNPIFGNTLNPKNHKRSPGGSSSGEAALIATGASILGLGTDLGGSIRLPASFCGICGFKTTSARLSSKGVTPILSGAKLVTSSLGPMARDVDSLVLCMRALLCDELFRLDPTVPPLPFNDQLYSCSKPLRIGYYESNGFFEPLPCMKRAMQQSQELLERAGHQLIHFPVLQIEYMTFELFYGSFMADGMETIRELL